MYVRGLYVPGFIEKELSRLERYGYDILRMMFLCRR